MSRLRLPSRLGPSHGRFCFLTVPGWQGSGPGHWQSVWERKYPFGRIQQSDWQRPRSGDWVGGVARAVEAADHPVILIAHSLGCVAVALWAQLAPDAARRVAAALFVAPPDLDRVNELTQPLQDFAPMPRSPLLFPSLLIGSQNDPYMTLFAARGLAAQWGSQFINAGQVGHINCASGFGDWPDGEVYLKTLLPAGCEIQEAVECVL